MLQKGPTDIFTCTCVGHYIAHHVYKSLQYVYKVFLICLNINPMKKLGHNDVDNK